MTEKKEGRRIAENRKAFHDYEILERFEAGISLLGPEVKSLRLGKVNLQDSFVRIKDGEAFIINMHIAPYEYATHERPDPLRSRKLLLEKKEIIKLASQVKEQGLTLIPLSLFWSGNWAKLSFGLAKGKKLYDKREALAEKSAKREIDRAMKRR